MYVAGTFGMYFVPLHTSMYNYIYILHDITNDFLRSPLHWRDLLGYKLLTRELLIL